MPTKKGTKSRGGSESSEGTLGTRTRSRTGRSRDRESNASESERTGEFDEENLDDLQPGVNEANASNEENSTRAGGPEDNTGPEADHTGGGQTGNANDDPQPRADETHLDLEEMLETRMIKARTEAGKVQKRIDEIGEDASEFNLDRLKTAISGLARAQTRVKETGKEIVAHNLQRNAGDANYAKICRRKQQQLVQETDDKIDEAQGLLDEKRIETKEKSPGDMKKMSYGLKPTTKLSKESTLVEQDAWFKEFRSFYGWNEGLLKSHPYATRRQILHNCISPGLVMELTTDSTMLEKDGEQKPVPIVGVASDDKDCLSKLRSYLLAENPIHLRRHTFQKLTQQDGEKFSTWWAAKLSLIKQCDMDRGLTRDSILVLELINGVFDGKLRQELIRKSSEIEYEGLVKIAKTWQVAEVTQTGLALDEADEAARKTTSAYNQRKNDEWSKRQEANTSANTQRNTAPGDNGRPLCRNCNTRHPRGECPAYRQECYGCNRLGHYARVCTRGRNGGNGGNGGRERDRTPRSRGREENDARRSDRNARIVRDDSPEIQARRARVYESDKVERMKSIRAGEVTSKGNSRPTPMMQNVTITPHGQGRASTRDCLPDTGCTQSLISEDIVKSTGMRADTSMKKKIKAVNDQKLECSGTVTFTATYEGRSTVVSALVSSSIQNEVLLSWKALVELGIIPNSFPHVEARAAGVSTSTPMTLEMAVASVKTMIGSFDDVFDTEGTLRTMKGKPMVIEMKDDAPIKPVHVCSPRRTAYAFQEAAKQKLDDDESKGVIEKVIGATDWCSAISFVKKPNGKIRSVLDLVQLNKYVKRPTHPFPSPRDIMRMIDTKSKCFAVFDAANGYWQIPLAEKSKDLTTFITEWGRYRYTRAPMGLISSGDEFCHRTDKALMDLKGIHKLVDDILICGTSYEELNERIRSMFERCREHGITLSAKKYQIGPEVTFAGYVINEEGTKQDPKFMKAIADFPAPTNLTDLRSLMGLVNRFTDSAPDLKQMTLPWRTSLKKAKVFTWGPLHDIALQKVKDVICNPEGPVLKHFEPGLPVQLLTDASRKGLGYCLVQMESHRKDAKPKLITAGSRYLGTAEVNYAVIELELLAIQWAVSKCRLYLAGTKFKIVTDHKPLLGIMNGKHIDAMNNVRIQRLMSKLLGFEFTVEWIAGKNHVIADALSRNPVFMAERHDDIIIRKVADMVPDPALEDVSKHAEEDADYQEVVDAIKRKVDIKKLPKTHPAQQYRSLWEEIAVYEEDRLLTIGNRIIVPTAARRAILSSIHIQHTGQTKTLDNARQLYFWPGMVKDIRSMVARCKECNLYLPSQPLEPQITTGAKHAFEKISVDLGYLKGTHYLVGVDRYSGFPIVQPLKRLDTNAIIDILEDWFLEHGKPVSIRSDGGPQFRNEFHKWCKRNHIIHEQASAYHHESNGHAESAVKDMKHLLGKTKSYIDFRKALLEYRNTPRYDGLSPAQWYYGRRQRTEAPALPSAYDRLSRGQFAVHEEIRRKRKEGKHQPTSTRDRPILAVGTKVLSQNMKTRRWDRWATVMSKRPDGRSYEVSIDGRVHLRNRRFLRLMPMQRYPTRNRSNGGQHVRKRATEDTGPRETQRRYPVRSRTQRRLFGTN